MLLTDDFIYYNLIKLTNALLHEDNPELCNIIEKINEKHFVTIYKYRKLCPVFSKLSKETKVEQARYIYELLHFELHKAEKISLQLN